jgi:hypothetical protein
VARKQRADFRLVYPAVHNFCTPRGKSCCRGADRAGAGDRQLDTHALAFKGIECVEQQGEPPIPQ